MSIFTWRSHSLQLWAGDELRGFLFFSHWLRCWIRGNWHLTMSGRIQRGKLVCGVSDKCNGSIYSRQNNFYLLKMFISIKSTGRKVGVCKGGKWLKLLAVGTPGNW